MNTKRLFITSMLASTLAIGTSVYASPFGGKNCGGKKGGKPSAEMMEKRFDRMGAKLGLSDEQKEQMKSFRENKKNSMRSLRDQKKSLREQMRQLDPKADDYDQKLAEIANTKAELTRSMTIARGESRKQMAQILTPEQQEKMQEMRKYKKGGHHRGFGKRHGENDS